MLAKIYSCAVVGIDGLLIEVEVDIALGLPALATVGLPDGAVRESKDRVKAAIKNCGYEFPNRRITVNLAPADVKKAGAGYDLPMALGILAASETMQSELLTDYVIIGELSLDGSLRPVKGVLSMAMAAKEKGFKGIIVPKINGAEAAVVSDLDVLAMGNLHQVVEFLAGISSHTPEQCNLDSLFSLEQTYDVDFEDVKGQDHIKRALEIAASGGHNILLKGPPGAGKTMLSKRLPTILPPLSFDEALETTRIYSITGLLNNGMSLTDRRPFRSPHHTISDAGLIGGGQIPRPGEVSLAHNGVLFLDELPEFKKHVLEVLRQPLEEGTVTISRANMSLTFPSRFVLAVSYNPCPCGYLGDSSHECTCTPAQIQRYESKLSGPLIDRIDMHLEVSSLPFKEMNTRKKAESSETIRKRVRSARNIQDIRYKDQPGIYCNSQMGPKDLEKHCNLDQGSTKLLETSINKLGLSARAYHRILKIARTIADMEQENNIQSNHVAEAVQYRRLHIRNGG